MLVLEKAYSLTASQEPVSGSVAMFQEKPNEVMKGQESWLAQVHCIHDLRPDLNQGCCGVGGIVRHPIISPRVTHQFNTPLKLS